jgi:hypothetical protein
MAVVHAYIEVRELEQGIDFYCRRLGLGLKRRLSRAWVELSGASRPIFLLANRPSVANLGRGLRRAYSSGIGHQFTLISSSPILIE